MNRVPGMRVEMGLEDCGDEEGCYWRVRRVLRLFKGEFQVITVKSGSLSFIKVHNCVVLNYKYGFYTIMYLDIDLEQDSFSHSIL